MSIRQSIWQLLQGMSLRTKMTSSWLCSSEERPVVRKVGGVSYNTEVSELWHEATLLSDYGHRRQQLYKADGAFFIVENRDKVKPMSVAKARWWSEQHRMPAEAYEELFDV